MTVYFMLQNFLTFFLALFGEHHAWCASVFRWTLRFGEHHIWRILTLLLGAPLRLVRPYIFHTAASLLR